MAGHRRESSVPLLLLAAALLLLGSRGSCSARADTVIDVRQMGAKGDGVANDTAPIAAAFAAAASASGSARSSPGGMNQLEEIAPPSCRRGPSADKGQAIQ